MYNAITEVQRKMRITVDDHALASELLANKFTAIKKLGMGTYGIAFLCTTPFHTAKDEEVVAKVPVEMVSGNYFQGSVKLPRTLAELIISRRTNGYAERFDAGLTELLFEFNVAESIHESGYVRALRIRQYAREVCGGDRNAGQRHLEMRLLPDRAAYETAVAQMVGKALSGLTPAQYYRAVAEQNMYLEHPGACHIHAYFHFDRTLPVLLSRRQDGTIDDLRTQSKTDRPLRAALTLATDSEHTLPPYLWTQIAVQLGNAMDFLLERALFVHLDLKPENIFYSRFPTSDKDVYAISCAISDFGLATGPNELIPVVRSADAATRELMIGTQPYVPSSHSAFSGGWFSGRTTAAQLAKFQFLATLGDMLQFAVTHDDPDTERLRGGPNEHISERLRTLVTARRCPTKDAFAYAKMCYHEHINPESHCMYDALAGLLAASPAEVEAFYALFQSDLVHAGNSTPASGAHFVDDFHRQHLETVRARAERAQAFLARLGPDDDGEPPVSARELDAAKRAPSCPLLQEQQQQQKQKKLDQAVGASKRTRR
jgi:serine/threonine protein kinase